MNAIKLYSTKAEAFYYKDSQRNVFYEFGGIQLIPNTTYTQKVTKFELANGYTAYVCRAYDDAILDVLSYTIQEQVSSFSTYANSTSIYADNTTLRIDTNASGIEYWSITPTNDYGNDLVYLKFGDSYYTNPFYITSLSEDLCTKFTYKDLPAQRTESIGLKVWFRQKSRQSELTTYYESSTKNTVTQAIKTHNLEMYESEFMSIDDLIMTATILESSYLYIGSTRYSLFEAIKIPELTQQENFGKLKFTLAPNN